MWNEVTYIYKCSLLCITNVLCVCLSGPLYRGDLKSSKDEKTIENHGSLYIEIDS